MARAMEHSLLAIRLRLASDIGFLGPEFLLTQYTRARRPPVQHPAEMLQEWRGRYRRNQAACSGSVEGLTAISGSSARRCVTSTPVSASRFNSASPTPSSLKTAILCSP